MTSYFPFANDYGANPICINLEDGGVYIVYMDLSELEDRCFHCLAESFLGFVEGLSEDSIDD
jgi:hypothetical protein